MIAITAVTALILLPAGPAQAHAGSWATGGDWVPAPSEPYDRPAGVLCDVPIHAEPIVDEVVKKVLREEPLREVYTGRLVIRVTNTGTGKSFDADVSGTSYVTYAADGAQTWYAVGPVLIGFREGAGNLPRGLWVIDGVYRIQFDSTLVYKTLTMVRGTTDDVCTHIV
jgi:hypothetical protein